MAHEVLVHIDTSRYIDIDQYVGNSNPGSLRQSHQGAALTDQPNRSSTDQVKPPTLPLATAEQLADSFKALGEPNRLRLLNLLAENGEMCVCDFPERLGISQPTVSHHLKVLTEAGLLIREKRGKWAFYDLAPDSIADLAAVLANSSLPETARSS